MSNNSIESLKKATLRIQELQQELLQERQAKLKLQEENFELTHEILEKDQRIAQLEAAIEDLEREKWSFQSELENLRGY